MPAKHRLIRKNRLTRICIAAGTGGAALVLPLMGAVSASAADNGVWDRVANCESTGNWSINTGNGFYGGLQFTESTWNGFGGGAYADRADHASKGQQIAVAQKVLAVQGPGAWPVCSVKAGLTTANGGAAAAPTAAPVKKAAPVEKAAPVKKAAPVEKAAPVNAPVKSAPAVAPKAAPAKNGVTYKVVSGDTLFKIADAHQVSGGWQELYAGNKQTVGDNPNLILPGQKLAVGAKAESPAKQAPAAPASSQAAKKSAAVPKTTAAKAPAPVVKAAVTSNAGNSSGWSLPTNGPIGTPYHRSGSMWSSGYHTGVDFVVPTGTAIKAIGEGTVVSAGWGGAYGNQIVIEHADGKYSQYAHMSQLLVSAGQTVHGGQQIGVSGATGNVSGPHLHFEVRTGPAYGSDVDPVAYLRAHGVNV